MSDQQLGPFDANGLLKNPFGTKWTDRQAEAIRQRRADEIAEAVKQREESEAQLKADQERERREAGARRMEAYRQSCLVKWLDNGGTETGFASAWPALRDT